jgi:hypothetical protein
MAEFNQNPLTQAPVNNSNSQDNKKQGAIVYFLGIIIVSVIVVGFIIFKILGLL